jgi:hypothetical protein
MAGKLAKNSGGGNLSKAVQGRKQSFTTDQVLEPTAPSAITPFSSLTWGTSRSFGSIPSSGTLDDVTCEDIETRQPDLMKAISRSIRALGKLITLEEKETELHVQHRKFQAIRAAGELERKQADANLAGGLLRQVPQYEALRQKLSLGADMADKKVKAVQDRFAEMRRRYEDQLNR